MSYFDMEDYGWNAGDGDMAHDTDEALLARAALLDLRQILAEHHAVPEDHYTRKNYPNEPFHALYYNILREKGQSNLDIRAMILARYKYNTTAKVGETVVCPGCGVSFVKRTYQHKFCGRKTKFASNCKDFVNNWMNPSRLEQACSLKGAKADSFPSALTLPKPECATRQPLDVAKAKAKYTQNKAAKIGALVHCPVCDVSFVKKTPAQAFCHKLVPGKASCKDQYHTAMKRRY